MTKNLFWAIRYRTPRSIPSIDIAKPQELKKRIRYSRVNGYVVSTVFLFVNHGSDDIPLLFETAYHKEPNGSWDVVGRTQTHREALKLHRQVKYDLSKEVKKWT